MMWRLVVPLVVATICGWVVLYGMPEEWQGQVWKEIKKWLHVASAVVGALFVIALATSLFL